MIIPHWNILTMQGGGGQEWGPSRIGTICYSADSIVESAPRSLDKALSCTGLCPVAWVEIKDHLNKEDAQALADRLNLHPVIVHEIVEHDPGRPKMLDFDEVVFVSLKLLKFSESDNTIEERQLKVILGKDFVITVTTGELPQSDLKENIRNPKSRIRRMGPDYLLYSILDSIVDDYYAVSEELGDRVEDIQDQIIKENAEDALERVQQLRRSLVAFRRAIWPFREAVNMMVKGESDLIGDNTYPYFREVYDHTIELMDTVDTSRDMLSEMIDIYQTNVSNQLNRVVKVLTVISVIFAPLTFIVGFYGMNFRNLPGFEHPLGYVAVTAVMITIGVAMIALFKRRRWF